MDDCIFCKIAKKIMPCYNIYEDEEVIVFLSIEPKTNGHTLIVPKKHYLDITDIDQNSLNYINEIAKQMYKLLEKKLNFIGLKIVQNNGYIQDVKHYHMHLIPIYNENELLSLDKVYEKIKN